MGDDLSYWGIGNTFKKNNEHLDVFSKDDLILTWKQKCGQAVDNMLGVGVKNISTGFSTSLDLAQVIKMLRDLGLKGKVKLIVKNGTQYIIFKGYAGTRSFFTGVKYGMDHVKVMELGLGKTALDSKIYSGAKFTIYFSVGVDILSYILNDNQTMSYLLGTVSSDIVKTAMSTAALKTVAYLVGVDSTTTVVLEGAVSILSSLGIVIVVGIAVFLLAEYMDNKYHLTDKLIKEIDVILSAQFKQRFKAQMKMQIDEGLSGDLGGGYMGEYQ